MAAGAPKGVQQQFDVSGLKDMFSQIILEAESSVVHYLIRFILIIYALLHCRIISSTLSIIILLSPV